MIRDTLEMVPVAVVLAVILSFGVRSAHGPTHMLSSRIVAGGSVASLEQRAPSSIGARSTSDVGASQSLFFADGPGRDSNSPSRSELRQFADSVHSSQRMTEGNADGSRMSARSMTARSTTARTAGAFLPRRTSFSGVPYFTAADLPSHEAVASVPAERRSDGAGLSTSATSRGRSDEDVTTSEMRSTETGGGHQRVTATNKLSINHAQIEDLVRIPGIGRSRATMILDQRPDEGYSSWDQIDALPGFGPGTLGMLMQHAELN